MWGSSVGTTIKHILTDCGDTALIRNNFFDSNSMKDILTNDNDMKLLYIKTIKTK
jgi:hypothetical protein